MDKKIKGGVYDLAFDEKRSRVYVLGPRLLHVYDAKTMKPIISLKRPRYANHLYIGKETDLVVIQSTEGTFMVYSAEDFSCLGQTRLRGEWNTDPLFQYVESENKLYGIAHKNLTQHLCCVSLQPLSCRLIPLTVEKKEGELLESEPYMTHEIIDKPDGGFYLKPVKRTQKEEPYTRYKFRRYENGSFYMIRNFYNVGGVGDRVYEALYGRFEEENGTLVLKEKLYSTKERCLEPLDLELTEEELALVRPFIEPCKVRENGGLRRFYRNEKGGLFLITSKHLFHLVNGKFEKEYSSEYFSDYKEFEGRRYFGDWEFLHVQDIPEGVNNG